MPASDVTVMMNGLPGAMGVEVSQACLRRGFSLASKALTGPGMDKHVEVVEADKKVKVELVGPEEAGEQTKAVTEMQTKYGAGLIIIDFTHPTAVNSNADIYTGAKCPFVMGTTGGDRSKLMKVTNDSETYAVIAPNMCKQIVAFQATMQHMSKSYPGAFGGYKLELVESHQSSKADTSGTAKAKVVKNDGEGTKNTMVLIGSDCIPVRSESASFKRITECFSVLLPEIGAFLAGSPTAAMPQGGSPRDLVHVFCLSARFVREEATFSMNALWEQAYCKRWPAFHQAARCNSKQQNWRTVYEDTQLGRCEFTLEVFDREKKAGFAMAAMPAQVQFAAASNGFIARYISASPVKPELIPLSEARRLRFCPASARDHLQPSGGFLSPGPLSADPMDAFVPFQRARATKNQISKSDYPYRVLRGTEGVEVGRGVELQWKMQEHSPFGWWYGILEAVREERGQNGERAVATISFRHFPRNSPWYQVDVCFGDGVVYPCMLGGTTGGVRPVSPEEDAVWKTFFPKFEVTC